MVVTSKSGHNIWVHLDPTYRSEKIQTSEFQKPNSQIQSQIFFWFHSGTDLKKMLHEDVSVIFFLNKILGTHFVY